MLKRMLTAGLWLALSAPAMAQVNALPGAPHLLVKGAAERSVLPDRFLVRLSLEFTEAEPAAARARVQAALERVLRAFRDSHALARSVDATTFAIGPDYAYENDKRVFKGTKAARRVEGVFASEDDTKAFLSRVQADEHVVLSEIVSSSSQEAAIRQALKREAIAQTKTTATLLADAYGTRLRGLYSVSDVEPAFAYGVSAGQLPPPPREPDVIVDTPSAMDVPAGAGNQASESLEVGTIVLKEALYAVFLIGD